jgi:bifunctional DNA-binding transcriptional regulator/antitoxin component of YhaV-PrlF toxin-antitoxin module
METTVTLSSKGQLALPKRLREDDALARSDRFRLQRLGPGKYLLEKLTPPKRPRARLVKSKDGFLVFRPPKGALRITRELVNKLEAETL